MEQKVEKITRERLRAMQNGDVLTVECENGSNLDSQKNTAYSMQRMEGCKCSCNATGLTLQVTRYGTE